MSAAVTSLPSYILRRSLMYNPLAEQYVRVLVRERQLKAEAENRAARLVTVRRSQRIVVR
jgi:hypothetical protein